MLRQTRKGIPFAILILLVCLVGAQPLAAQSKRLQVIAEMAAVHLGPDSGSPVVETLLQGATMTLASAMKSRASWFYVYFISVQTGKTRAGYVLDSLVRKLYADLKVISISSEDEIAQPKELDFTDAYRPIIAWGMNKDALISTEGKPIASERSDGREIVRYRRLVLAKRSLVEYVFESGRLVAARFRLLENYADKNRYIEDYKKLKDYAIGKIGQPREDQVIWQDPSFRSNDARWGAAVSNGQLEFRSEWDSPKGDLMITLAGENSRVNLGAEFNDPRHKSASF